MILNVCKREFWQKITNATNVYYICDIVIVPRSKKRDVDSHSRDNGRSSDGISIGDLVKSGKSLPLAPPHCISELHDLCAVFKSQCSSSLVGP